MFQLKFCLKSFETCLLFYVSSVRECRILAIILFKHYNIHQVAEMVREGGLKNSRRVRASHPCQYHTFAVCQYNYQMC